MGVGAASVAACPLYFLSLIPCTAIFLLVPPAKSLAYSSRSATIHPVSHGEDSSPRGSSPPSPLPLNGARLQRFREKGSAVSTHCNKLTSRTDTTHIHLHNTNVHIHKHKHTHMHTPKGTPKVTHKHARTHAHTHARGKQEHM